MKIIIVLLCLVSTSAYSQSLDYKILWRGDSVGYVHAERYDSLQFRVLTIESSASIWLFGTKHIVSKFHSVFEGDKLHHADMSMRRNGSLKEKTRTFWLNDHYEVIIDDEVQEPILHPITQTVASLYFQLPDEGYVYSERLGVEMPFRKSDDLFELEKPGGRLNTYTFGRTFCNLVEVDNSLTKLYIVRINDQD